MSDGGGNVVPGGTATYTNLVVTKPGGTEPDDGRDRQQTRFRRSVYVGHVEVCGGLPAPRQRGWGNVDAVLGPLAPGAQATFTVTATVAASASGTLSNTATVLCRRAS